LERGAVFLGLRAADVKKEAGGMPDPSAISSLLMSTVLFWKGWDLISYLFEKKHGASTLKEIDILNATKLNVARGIKPTNNKSAIAKASMIFEERGEKVRPNWLSQIPLDSKIIFGGALAVLASYLHLEGSETMRRHTTAMKVDYEHPLEAGLAQEGMLSIPSLKRMCYNLYLDNDYYYDPTSTNGYISSPVNNNAIRIIINTMVGMFQRMGVVDDTKDPIDTFVKTAELIGYWEVTARLIGMYGWAPVYVATQWLMKTMLGAQKTWRHKRI
jgi:hypothetical protein